ncbi:pituitary tumor-transforming gene 1 protein-interacting protein-like isoform X2 [Mizuhopecten yessoensis]|uniref:Pituitary tumor-transforming gene 1 protein-interacting protein n=1 Tax=Mizuhopecten yessoensis TaxID=6573 RepID=A0A210PU47_MIZYE|nr:pituitary tumor-transforming gene 1 protein-interacting protein-like isoform X2 [Mizuhopecten yessoensis]OWF39976.1 Pituitary tumor-transforming gene 1 protein-interacting protein [Mizuhopecten yessoensis]
MKCLNVLCAGTLILLMAGGSYGATTTGKHTTQVAPTTEAPATTQKHTVVTTHPPAKQTTAGTNSSTMTPEEECQSKSSGCHACLNMTQCLWCKSKNTCLLYPTGDILPHASLCPLEDARWGVCWVNFKVLIIVMGCIGGLIFLVITICICKCCCCKKNNSASYAKDEAKEDRRKADRKAKSDERRADRKTKTDEIRRKYGLIKEDNPYSRFDA